MIRKCTFHNDTEIYAVYCNINRTLYYNVNYDNTNKVKIIVYKAIIKNNLLDL